MKKIFFLSPRKQTVTMPQSKPKNKLRNRVFAVTLVIILLAWMHFWVVFGAATAVIKQITEALNVSPMLGVLLAYCTLLIGLPIIIIGLFYEIWKPSLDFTFHRNWKWVLMGVFLLGVFVIFNVYWGWYLNGWQGPYEHVFLNFFFGYLACETSSLALLFGILFMTHSTPKKSLSYRIMLIGAVLIEVPFMFMYIGFASGKGPGYMPQFENFWTETIFQSWFWLDLTSEVVILVGALWLMFKGKGNINAIRGKYYASS